MRDVLKVVLFMGLIHCGFSSSRVITTLYVLHYKQPSWMVGVILSLYAFLPALISIHIGKWIDKVGIRLPFFISVVMIAAACLFPILLPYTTAGVWPVYPLCLLAGTGFLFALISGQGLIGYLSNNKNRATAFTYQSIAFSLSGSAGPVIAGYLIDHGGYSMAYAAALAFAVVGGLVFLIFTGGLPNRCSNARFKNAEKHSAFELFAHPIVRNILIASALVSMAWDLQAFMIPVYGTEIGLDAVAIGWLLSTFSICTFAVRAFMPFISNLFREWTIIIFVLISAGITYLIFPFVTNLFLLFVFCGWLGASLGASQPNVMSLLHQETPDGRVGEAIGIRTMLMNLSHTALPLLFGFGGSVVGAAAAFWTLGGTMVGGGFFVKQSNRKHHVDDIILKENVGVERKFERRENEEIK